MESTLTGTAALITGARSGIGAATARRLAEHGAAAALVARRRERVKALAAEIDKAGGTALVVEADITHRAQAEAAVQQTVVRFGRFDTLVNNAGLMLLVTAPLSGLSRLLRTSRVSAASLAEAGVAVEGDAVKAKTLLTSVASAG